MRPLVPVTYLCIVGHTFIREVHTPHDIRACRGQEVSGGLCLARCRPMTDAEHAAYILGGPGAINFWEGYEDEPERKS